MSRQPVITSWPAWSREFGLELQRLRVDAGLSQEELAHRCGVTRNYYQLLERGLGTAGQPANPTIKVVLKLSEALGSELSAMLPTTPELGRAED